MNKSSEDFVCLKNVTISQITFGINFISLLFDNGYIQINAGFKIKSKNSTIIWDEIFPVNNDFGLLSLLDVEIINVNYNTENSVLSLFFENENELTLFGENLYESFEVKIGEKRIIV